MTAYYIPIKMRDGRIENIIVDADNYLKFKAMGWHETHGYAVSVAYHNGEPIHILMHREVLGLSNVGKRMQPVTHINGNSLDNRRENLSITSWVDIQLKMGPRNGRKYKGTVKHQSGFKAYLKINGKNTYIAYSRTEEGAARAYDRKVYELYGAVAYLNFPKELIKDTNNE